jgi:transposase-like protein
VPSSSPSDQQSTDRQNLVLDEAGIEEDPGTSSRLVRGTGHILDVLDVFHRDCLALRIHDGAFSAMRLRAAEAKGSKGGRRPAVTAGKAAAVRAGYLGGQSIAGLARDHHVSRGAIRTAVADLMPEHTDDSQDTPAPKTAVTLDMPGKVADFLCAAEPEPAERAALDQGVTVRRGQGYTLRVPAVPSVHRQLLCRCQPLDAPLTASAPSSPRSRSKPSELQDHPVALFGLTSAIPQPRAVALTDADGVCLGHRLSGPSARFSPVLE